MSKEIFKKKEFDEMVIFGFYIAIPMEKVQRRQAKP
jgi:hypothetical protein